MEKIQPNKYIVEKREVLLAFFNCCEYSPLGWQSGVPHPQALA
jgi:hypothetical protein